MNFELKAHGLLDTATLPVDALVVLLPDGEAAARALALAPWLRPLLAEGHLETGLAKSLQSFAVAGVKAPRVMLVRAGDGSPAHVQKAVSAAVVALKHPAVKKIAIWMGDGLSPSALHAAVLAAADAAYAYTATLSKPPVRHLQKILCVVPERQPLQAAFAQACATARGVEFAREWANRPANHATPSQLADAARQLGKSPRIQTTVLGPKEVAALGMGAFMAVAQGSAQPLRFIAMRYQGAAKTEAPVVLVGKGITFDTGGISIKPAPEMDEMKFDMGGAASVLGVFAALAELQPAVNVVGLIPACENMPDGLAVKPGDVVTSMSGQTIEILNTDAEGRLVLCDALHYARRFKPRSVIDIATLTGACVIALGSVRSGLFSADDALADRLYQAGQNSLDLCWRLPLDDAYAEGLKSNFADIANVGGRPAGAVTAAKFLQKFTSDLPWAHLDIAGTAWKSGAAKGATGRPVPLLMRYLLDLPSTPRAAKSSASPKVAKTRAR